MAIYVALLIISVLPFVWLSIYNHPFADDYWFANVIQEKGFWAGQIHWYTNVTGRFITSVINSLNPLVFGNFWFYKALPIIHITLFIACIFLSIKLFVGTKFNRKSILIASGSVFFIFSYSAFSMRQAFYWLPSYSNYMVPSLLSFLVISLYANSKIFNQHIFQKILIMATLVFVIGGLNETPSIMLGTILGFILIAKYLKHSKIDYQIVILILVLAISLIIVAMSGGTTNRVDGELSKELNGNRYELVFTVISAIKYTILFSINRLNSPLLLVLLLFFISSGNHIEKNDSLSINPFLAFLLVFIVVFIGFLPSFYFLGRSPYPRVLNAIYLFFIFGLIYVFYCIKSHYWNNQNNQREYGIIKLIIIVYLVFGLKNSNSRGNNIAHAYADILGGYAVELNLNLDKHYLELKKNTNKSFDLTPIINNNKILNYNYDFENINSLSWKKLYFINNYKKDNR